MPVRKIPKSFRSVTGRFPSMINGRCIGYESKLEHDYFLRCEFDHTILSYEEQPLQISGVFNGREVVYTLDCLVKYKDDRPNLLVEIKYNDDLQKMDERLETKLARANEYAAENGMRFATVTEKEVNGIDLDNYRLLYRFAKPTQKISQNKTPILDSLRNAGSLTLKALLDSISVHQGVRADYTTAIWHLLYTGEIETDLNIPLGNQSMLRIQNG